MSIEKRGELLAEGRQLTRTQTGNDHYYGLLSRVSV